MKEEFHEYLKYFLSPNNPILISLLFVVLVTVLVYFISKYIILPLNKKHQDEKHEIELKSSRLMALFAELDPDPIIRINSDGLILLSNQAAKKLFSLNDEPGNILTILPFLSANEIRKGIESNNKFSDTIKMFDNHYTVLFVGNSNLNIAQVYFRDITKRKILEDRLKKLGNYLQEQIEEERNRIASELHDSIGQGLLLIKLRIQKIEQQLRSASGEKEFIQLDNILQDTISELKTIIYNLRPKILDELGLGPAITSLVSLVTDQSGIKGSLNIHNLNSRLDKRIELFTFRLAQETLNNIMKHSHAGEFNLIVQENPNNLRLIVSDNGIGFDLKTVGNQQELGGFGLLNMKERVESFGGEIKIDSTPGEGTVVMATIPIKAN
ncbi:MAG TPA: sensor histidine kinase [Ignavibacteriaceae bacterium]